MSRYKLLSYTAEHGHPRAGIAIDDLVYDAGALLNDPSVATVEDLLRAWTVFDIRLAAIADDPDSITTVALGRADAATLVPFARPGAIFCVGANYRSHINHMAAAKGVDMGRPQDELGLPPYVFMKPLQSLAPSGAIVSLDSAGLDYEGELGLVIGSAAKDVPVDRALDHVAGYIVANDLSARDRFMRPGVPPASPFRCDWTGHKVFDGSLPVGAAMLPARFVPDPQQLRLTTRVNGELRQDSSTGDMMYSVAQIIAYLSSLVTLRPGDIVLTGTPAGVGSERGTFLADRDEVTVAIDGIGSVLCRVNIPARTEAPKVPA